MAKVNQYNPRKVSHPGVTLKAKIEEMGMSVHEFAGITEIPEKVLLNIVNGEKSISADIATHLEAVTKIPAHFWLSRQKMYNDLISREKPTGRISISADWIRNLTGNRLNIALKKG